MCSILQTNVAQEEEKIHGALKTRGNLRLTAVYYMELAICIIYEWSGFAPFHSCLCEKRVLVYMLENLAPGEIIWKTSTSQEIVIQSEGAALWLIYHL